MSDFANLEDSGLFISVAHEPGIAHPPGYPLYTMLAHLFTWIPLGSIAERVHALSAIAGISSCILLFEISRELKADSLSALVAASCLGVSSSFWYQAITAEIHPEYFFFLVALSARIKTTKRINQLAVDGYGLYLGAKSNQSLAVDVDYGTCLIPYHSSSMERFFAEFRQRFFLLRFRINSLPLSSCSFLE